MKTAVNKVDGYLLLVVIFYLSGCMRKGIRREMIPRKKKQLCRIAIIGCVLFVLFCLSGCKNRETKTEFRSLLQSEINISNDNKNTITYKYDEYGRCVLKEEVYYTTFGGNEKETRRITTTFLFDRKGYLVKEIMETTYEEPPKQVSETSYSYSSDGTLIKKTIEESSEGSKYAPYVENVEYEYENNGDYYSVTEKHTEHGSVTSETREYKNDKLIRYSKTDHQGVVTILDELYDKWGNRLGCANNRRLTLYDRYGTKIWFVYVGYAYDDSPFSFVEGRHCIYDKRDNLTYLSVFDIAEGTNIYKFTYDECDRILSLHSFFISKDMESQSLYDAQWTYNADGSFVVERWGKKSEIDGDWRPWYHIIEEYSIGGKPLTEKYYNEEGDIEFLSYESLFSYSNNERIETTIYYDESGSTISESSIVYIYDGEGNLILHELKRTQPSDIFRSEYVYSKVEVLID